MRASRESPMASSVAWFASLILPFGAIVTSGSDWPRSGFGCRRSPCAEFLRAFQFVDIGAGAEPLDDPPRCVAERCALHEEPSITTIGRPEPAFDAVRFTRQGRVVPGVPCRLFVVRMKGGIPTSSVTFLRVNPV